MRTLTVILIISLFAIIITSFIAFLVIIPTYGLFSEVANAIIKYGFPEEIVHTMWIGFWLIAVIVIILIVLAIFELRWWYKYYSHR